MGFPFKRNFVRNALKASSTIELPPGWEYPKIVDTDSLKIFLVNQTEQIFLKGYFIEGLAQAVYDSYQAIFPYANNLTPPILYPLRVQNNFLLFPLLDLISTKTDIQPALLLKQCLSEQLPKLHILPLAKFLNIYQCRNGETFAGDIYKDNGDALKSY
ncbi:MAG: hypothetical protein WCJ58_05790 [bacterium]